MKKTAESTEQIRRKRLAAAWARAYGADRAVPRQQEVDAERRPIADAHAAWQRWHGANLDFRWSAMEWPWFEALERARVEQLASAHLPGIASNLADPDRTAPPPGLPGEIYRCARRIFSGADALDEPVFGSREAQGPYQRWKGWLARRHLPPESDIIAALRSARPFLGSQTKFSDCIEALVHALSELEQHKSLDLPASNAGFSTSALCSGDKQTDEAAQAKEDLEEPGRAASESDIYRVYPDYRIYSTARDETGPAEDWLCPQDSELLKSLVSPDRLKIRQLAHKLQRRLQAASLRQWQFDQEEGLLDSRRLSRLISARASHRVFRRESESPVPSACVCFLVDLSSSMRGDRLLLAAMTVDLAIHTLERCGIASEVLGYTTTHGADNPASAQWKRAGSPENPGRLNVVRHIVFKTSNQRWRRARHRLALMLRRDFGHENIDGEALHWAARRLSARPESNRILMVLSDGQPYDEATANANGRAYLEDHLRSAVKEIGQSGIRLVAVGAGMNVSRFYDHAVTLEDPNRLGEHLFKHLENLLIDSQEGRDHR